METTDDDLRPAYIETGSLNRFVPVRDLSYVRGFGQRVPEIPEIDKANNNHRYRPDKLQYELHIPNRVTRVGVGFSGVTILFFASLCVTAIFSCIIFRLWLSGMHRNHRIMMT